MTERQRLIRPRDRDAIIQSLRAGVTPKTGLQHIQVGRAREVEALLKDIGRILDGGAAFRLVVGAYGSGKSFFLQLVRAIALEKGLVTLHADLSPDRRLYATGGQARNLYAELTRNLSTRTRPDGNGVQAVVEKFLAEARKEADSGGGTMEAAIERRLGAISELVGGYDFASVVKAYWRGFEAGDDGAMANAVRWLRGEFATRTDARAALGVRTIIDDGSVYDALKIMSLFVRQAGYGGLLVCLDEMVTLYKLASQRARLANYEQILRILNDCLQGTAGFMGFILCGTPDFLYDPRKGLFSYEALQSRLTDNMFAKAAGVVDYDAPVLPLGSLTPEELYVLLGNIRNVYASGDPAKYLVPDEALTAFLEHCSKKIGEAYFRTPRSTIKAFADFLAVLEQNPAIQWTALIDEVPVEEDRPSDMPEIVDDEKGAGTAEPGEPSGGLASFRL